MKKIDIVSNSKLLISPITREEKLEHLKNLHSQKPQSQFQKQTSSLWAKPEVESLKAPPSS